jgi:hypothetical protein
VNKKIVILLAVIIYLSFTYLSYSFFTVKEESGGIHLPIANYIPPGETEVNKTGETIKEPKTEECPLNGQMFGATQKSLWEKRRPLGVMIENHKDARPQSGLTSADIIYEAVAEGGITRFLTIFYCQDAKYVGPVRSARIYFIDMLSEYGRYPLYTHVGGANTPGPADALGKIRELNWDSYNDLNQFGVPFPNFWRDYERLPGRITEHTVYTTTAKLWEYAKTKRNLTNLDENNKLWDEDFEKWKFKDGALVKGELTKISFDFWQGKEDYSVEWQYDKSSNSFKRFNGGQPHMDKNNDKQIESKNLVIIFMKESMANDGYEGGHLLYKTAGSGETIIFQDGKAIKGEWRKKDIFSRIKFYDEKGKEIAFNRGQIFIEILPIGNKVTY